MKRSILIAAVIFITCAPLASFAQHTFPLTELQKLTGKNAGDFETNALEKDYSLQSKLSSNIMKVYTSDKPGPEGKKYILSRYQVPNAMAKITFSTTDKKYYIDIKTHLASSGLKFVKEENKTMEGAQAECNNYANGSLKVSLCSYTTDVTWYVVEVHL